MKMNRLHKAQDGWVLVIAMLVMVLMLGIGLAALSLTDTQSQQSRKERERESSLNLAEGALYSQSFILALPPSSPNGATEGWPGTAVRAYPASGCSQTTPALQCPDDATLANVANTVNAPASFQGVDVNSASAWTTVVQDDGAVDAPSSDYANAATAVHWDANKNKRVWVRATATVRGHTRVVVALMQIEQLPVPFPRVAISAGSFATTNNGNHGGSPIVDTGGTGIQVRCTTPPPSSSCADYGSPDQITPTPPNSISTGLSKPGVLTPELQASMKQTAIENGTYFPVGLGGADNCPTGTQLTGAVVYVEKCTHSYGTNEMGPNCTYDGKSYTRCANGGTSAGALIWEKGTLEFGGQATFIGVVYHLNNDNCGSETPNVPDGPTCPSPSNGQSFIVSIQGNAQIVGALNIDGGGGVALGSNAGPNMGYNPNVFNDIYTLGTTGLVQNSWQELN
jgi:Tfp pilus assembly protein PilX